MDPFWIFATLTALGLVAYGLQVMAIRSLVSRQVEEPCAPRHSAAGSLETTPPAEEGEFLAFTPPVSILKPLKGLDDRLFDNLESFCRLDYPEYEIIFSHQDRNDPAFRVLQTLREHHPEMDMTIVVQRCETGLNPKVNNLLPAYRAAKHQYILISDSNVRVAPSYLREIVSHMADPTVGLVCNIIRGVGGHSVGSVLENLHLNSFIMGSVCFLDRFLKMPCVVGKSMLMRRCDLDEIGGLYGVKDILAEDYMIGSRLRQAGSRIVLSGHMVDNVNDYWDLRRFLNRHTRWGKMRWKIGGIRYLSELLGNPVFLAWIPVAIQCADTFSLALAGGVSIVKMLGDAYLGRKIYAGAKRRHYLLAPLKDLIIGVVWFVPLLSSSVSWRGNRYHVGKDTLLSPISPAPVRFGRWSLDSWLTGRATWLRSALRT